MESIDRYRRYLKRRNFSAHTVKGYMNKLSHFTSWLITPVEEVTRREIGEYIDHLMARRLSPKTITCHLQTIRVFFDYLITDEDVAMANPITKVSIRLPKPLPRHLKDDQVGKLLAVITISVTRRCSCSCCAAASGSKKSPGLPLMQSSSPGIGYSSPTARVARTGWSI